MLKLYNTLTRKKEIFRPIKTKKINLFACGPTVYDFAHLGHAKTYVAFDVIIKYLRKNGFDVFYLQNITDIDDKIIKRAREKRVTLKKLASDFEKKYFKDMKELKIDSVTKYARATNHIGGIISQVERLLEKGYAYQTEDGIYYDISRFKDYGKLARRTVSQAEDGVSRIDESIKKRNKGDFCLWKLSKPKEPKWKSPWGWGRPGWHIEDTAITEKYFGPQYDIHGGGQDLMFPHHEAEISQMEAISGKKPLANYWLHIGLLTVQGRKMAKSLGNFITIKDFLKKYNDRLLRFFFVKSHYRSPIDYSENAIFQTKKELEKIDEFVNKLSGTMRGKPARLRYAEGIAGRQNPKIIKQVKEKFEKAMEDDFNTVKAIAAIFELINQANPLIDKNLLGQREAKQILGFLKKIDEVFCFIFWKKEKKEVPQEILKLVQKREKFRRQKNWREADETRKEIEKLGYQIEDTKKGPKIKKI